MLVAISRVRLGAAALLLCTGSAPAADDVSRWDGDARSSVRLIAGSYPGAAVMVLRAGIEIRLKQGWHTYWRYPGDAGVPPQFDFKGSQNVKSVDVQWPAPQGLPEAGGISIGYAGDVIFPLRVVPQEAARPAALALRLDYAICEKLCVPAQAQARLAFYPGSTSHDAMLAAAEARIPQKRSLGEAGPLVITSVRREPGPLRPRIVVDVAAPALSAVELFAEGPTPQWALPVPERLDGAAQGQRRFVFDLDGLPPEASAHGVPITLTAVTPEQAIEVVVRLD